MDPSSDTDPPTGGSTAIKGNSKAPRARPTRVRETTTSATQPRNQSPAQIRAKGAEKGSRAVGYNSSDSAEDEWDYDPLPADTQSRRRGIPTRTGSRVDTPIYPRAPYYDRDSGFYGNTSAYYYPPNPFDPFSHPGYSGFAGPGQMVPAVPYTSTLTPYVHLHQDTPHHLAPYIPQKYSRDDRAGTTPQDVAVILRKTKLPAANEKTDTSGISPLNDIDAVWNVASTRDITLHLELDVEDDIDGNLQEFVAFTRRGDYKRAEQYYQDNLSRHSEQPKVIVEYVRMLLEQGSYKSIRDMGIDEVGLVSICRDIRTRPNAFEAFQLLLLLHLARIRSDPDINACHFTATLAAEFLLGSGEEQEEEPEPLNHAEIQVFSLYADLIQTLRSQSSIMLGPSSYQYLESILTNRLRKTYERLFAESHCWDIRDLIIASIDLWGLDEAFEEIFSTSSTGDSVSRLFSRWKSMEKEELSDLALLDILNYIDRNRERLDTLRTLYNTRDLEGAWRTASDLARALADSIRNRNPDLMKSRSYLEWLLYQEMKERKKTQDSRIKYLTVEAFGAFPGKALSLTDTFVYVPVRSENPGWPVSYPNGSDGEQQVSQLLSVALRTAQELGDYKIEAECLHELVCRAENPSKHLAELERLQISVKGSQLGLLRTRLMRYMTVAGSDEKTRQSLKSQLLELDPRLQSIWRGFSHPLWEWAYRRVLFALMCSLGEGDTEQAMAVHHQGQAQLHLLPGWATNIAHNQPTYPEPWERERSRGGTRNMQRGRFRSPSPPPPPRPPPAGRRYRSSFIVNAAPGEERRRETSRSRETREISERATPEGNERIAKIREREERYERQKSARFDQPVAKSSQSVERPRPSTEEPGSRETIKRQLQELEEERRKQNELIKKRAEEEKQREREEEMMRKAQNEMQILFEEKRRRDEMMKLEQEKIRVMAEKEAREKMEREAYERQKSKAMEEALRAKMAAEIRAQIEAENHARAAAREHQEKTLREAKEEARKEFELERRAKKEAATVKRKAKKDREAREAEIFEEAEASARRKMLAEIRARVPGRKLRAMLGILGSESEGSDMDRWLIEDVRRGDSDSSSSVAERRREVRSDGRRMRRYSSSSSSGIYGSDSLEEGRRRTRRRRVERVIVERYRISPGGTRHRTHSDESDEDEDGDKEKGQVVEEEVEVRVVEEGVDKDEGGESSSGSSKGKGKEVVNEEVNQAELGKEAESEDPPEAPEPQESAPAAEPIPTEEPKEAVERGLENKSKVAGKSEGESQEEPEEQGGKKVTSGNVDQEEHDSSEDELLRGKVPDEVLADDDENAMDIYD